MNKKTWFLVILFASGCGKPPALDEPGLMNFLSNELNGLTRTIEEGRFRIRAAYKPTDLIVVQRMNTRSRKEFDSLRNASSSYVYFVLTIEKDGKDLETAFARESGAFASRIEYMVSDFSRKIKITGGSGDILLADYVYMRSFGIGPSNFLLAFERPVDDFELVIEGYQIGFGKITFPFFMSDIENIPQLKI